MKILLSLLLLTLSTAVLSQNTDTTVSTQTTPPTTSASVPETTASATTTTAATTTEGTTTEVPTTTPETTTLSTTDAPTTTSTGEPVTTPSPVTTAAPGPEKCSFNITQKGVTCIRAELKVQFIIPNEDKSTIINLGCDASSAESDCSSNDTQTLILVEPNRYNFTMTFEKDGNKVFVRNVTFAYTLPGGMSGSGANNDKHFPVKAGNSYLCRSETKIKLENVTMDISEIHVQAFEEKDSENFGASEECEEDDKVSDVVPIAVGVALAALIIIVLIAYLVGRRRSRQKGYQSV